ncbi:hypothetical protein KR044_006971, partial [Drosophila immigrans]
MADINKTNSPTSEVGSPQPQHPEIILQLLEAQNQKFLEFLKAMQTPAKTTTRETSVTLPTFNPESAGADAAAWCKTANMILTEHPLEGSALVMTLSKSLAGSASQWLSQICYVGMTWPQFQELFTHRYESADTPAAILFNLLNGRPSANECLSVYCSR